ncbi:hypothetical protein AB1N83_005256 [Pleurotus pulmonarius]
MAAKYGYSYGCVLGTGAERLRSTLERQKPAPVPDTGVGVEGWRADDGRREKKDRAGEAVLGGVSDGVSDVVLDRGRIQGGTNPEMQ